MTPPTPYYGAFTDDHLQLIDRLPDGWQVPTAKDVYACATRTVSTRAYGALEVPVALEFWVVDGRPALETLGYLRATNRALGLVEAAQLVEAARGLVDECQEMSDAITAALGHWEARRVRQCAEAVDHVMVLDDALGTEYGPWLGKRLITTVRTVVAE